VPSVCCVLPVYNAARFLPAWWARNGRELTEVGAKLIVIDNASQDSTIEEIRKFNYKELHLIRHPFNAGAEESLKTAKKHIDSRYRILLPADDWLAPGYLSTAVDALENNRTVGVVYGKSFLVDLSNGNFSERLRPPRVKGSQRDSPFAALAFNNFIPDISLFRSDALNCDPDSANWFSRANQVGILKNFDVYFTAEKQCFSGKHSGQLSKQWATSGRYYAFYMDMIAESRNLFNSSSSDAVLWYLFLGNFHSGRTLFTLLGDARHGSPYFARIVEANLEQLLRDLALVISDELAALGRASIGKLGTETELQRIIGALSHDSVREVRRSITGRGYDPQF